MTQERADVPRAIAARDRATARRIAGVLVVRDDAAVRCRPRRADDRAGDRATPFAVVDSQGNA
jgi:hypothetical protein